MKFIVSGLQYFLGFYFLFVGVMHFVLPAGLPAPMAWMYELSPGLHWFTGTAEILAGLALLALPALKRNLNLLPLAAAGLMVIMLGALVWHFGRGEISNAVQNAVLAGFSGFLAFARWKLYPLTVKS